MSTAKRGQEIELAIEKFADRGKALARVDGLVVFVKSAVPGDRVRAKVYRRKKTYAEAEVVEVLEASPLRTAPRCRYAGPCGGCTWQHVDYEAQLAMKQQSVHEALVHQGGFDDVDVRPTLGAEKIYDYRNRMDFNFSSRRWLTRAEIATGEDFDTGFALGLHPPGQPFKVIDLEECHLQSALSRRLVNGVRAFAKKRGWAAWDIKKHEGFLKHLAIRQARPGPSPRSRGSGGERTDEVMAHLVTNGRDEARIAELAGFFRKKFPEVTTFVNTAGTDLAQTIYEGEAHVVFGEGVIHDRIGPYTFEIGPTAFFQTNTEQAEHLYEVARAFADVRAKDLLYDLYCGTGTLSLFVADAVRAVVGVELSREAVGNARANAEANGITNCTFVAGDMLKLFTEDFVSHHGRPDVLIADPPRAGMHKKVVRRIAEIRPERFVYVSCNPQTQARDLRLLADAYRIEAVQPVDLFPHTDHVESVIALRAVA